MRILSTLGLTAWASVCLCTGICLAAEPADLIEFGEVKDAKTFGWEALPGAVLTAATPGKIGDHALRIDPGPEPKEYMGIGLRHNIDLTGAGPEDKLVLFVKQNFGNDLCANVRTPKGNVYRYARMKPEQWTRVELDLDLANWLQDNKTPVDAWTEIGYLHIYSRGFDKAGEYMLMDGFAVFVGGKPVVTRPKAVPARE